MAGGTTQGDVRRLITYTLMNDLEEVSGRVSSSHPDLKEITEADYPSAVVDFRTGRILQTAIVQNMIFELWIYSRKSLGEAEAIYDAAFALLQAERLTLANVDSAAVCSETQRGTDEFDSLPKVWAIQGLWIARAIGG